MSRLYPWVPWTIASVMVAAFLAGVLVYYTTA